MNTLAQELRERLNQGVVYFKFTKTDGTERIATGTRLASEVGGEAPTGRGTEAVGVIAYWDLDKNAWRSCREDSVVELIKLQSIERYLSENCEE